MSSWFRRRHSAFAIRISAFALLLAVILLLSIASSARAQFVDPADTKSADAVRNAFIPVTTRPSQSTVRILADNKPAALGIVVSPAGYILTKASELSGDLTVRVRMGATSRDFPATLVGLIEEQDLAMLKIDLKDAAPLTPIAWIDSSKVTVGQWVAATTTLDRPLAVGIISVGRRKIPGRPGLLGVLLGDAPHGGRILEVLPESAAEKVGLHVDDIITHVDGKPTTSRDELIATLHAREPGDTVTLTVTRAADTLAIKATLTTTIAPPDPRGFGRFETTAILTGPISKRSTNFPLVIQHDTVLRPADCGGPLVDLDGKALGINIARAGRTETYTIPADVLIPLIPQLIAGKFPPPADGTPHGNAVPGTPHGNAVPDTAPGTTPGTPHGNAVPGTQPGNAVPPATQPATRPITPPPPTLPRRKAA